MSAAVSYYEKVSKIELGLIDESAGRCPTINLEMSHEAKQTNDRQKHREAGRTEHSCERCAHSGLTFRITDPAPLVPRMKLRRYRQVRPRSIVSSHVSVRESASTNLAPPESVSLLSATAP